MVQIEGGGVSKSSSLIHTLSGDDPLHCHLNLLTTDGVLQSGILYKMITKKGSVIDSILPYCSLSEPYRFNPRGSYTNWFSVKNGARLTHYT